MNQKSTSNLKEILKETLDGVFGILFLIGIFFVLSLVSYFLEFTIKTLEIINNKIPLIILIPAIIIALYYLGKYLEKRCN